MMFINMFALGFFANNVLKIRINDWSAAGIFAMIAALFTIFSKSITRIIKQECVGSIEVNFIMNVSPGMEISFLISFGLYEPS